MRPNVLRYLPNDEKAVATLLRALCVLKPIREVVVRLFTDKEFGADKVEFEGLTTEFHIGEAIPDMCLQADRLCVIAEIKVSDRRGLTPNQPETYLLWLARQPVDHKFFVLLVPPQYAEQHRQEYERRKAAFRAREPDAGVRFVEINWLDLRSAFNEADLSEASVYARDFRALLEEWYIPVPVKFTPRELGVTDMFSRDAAKAVCDLFDFINKIALKLEREGFNIERAFQKRWWDPEGEYGIYISCENQYVLWLGVWTAFWRDHGRPLCIAVQKGKWHPAIIRRFKNAFPDHLTYPPNDSHPYLTKCIEQHLLGADAVRDVADWLQEAYLDGICAVVGGKQPNRMSRRGR
ncbi:MAG: hypothetical protein Q8Q12_01225 [bacterium]|nr:hypothetical protein [bacterium]